MNKFLDKTFLVDFRIDEDIEKYLSENNVNYVKTIKKENLYEEISGHPDIVACNFGDITVMEPETYDKLFDKLKKNNIMKGESILKSKYPYDIAYNFVVTEKYIIGKLDYMDNVLEEYAKNKKLKFINVNQGYARCSTIALPNNIFITSDKSIYNTLKSNNIQVHIIETEEIYLSERYSGFLGGSCFVYDDEVYFFGDIKSISYYDKLEKIFLKYNIKYKSMSKKRLRDYGSAIII